MKLSFKGPQISAFRLTRHHLAAQDGADLGTVCQSVCGVQSQVMGAAQMALWARTRGLTRADIHSALWKSRTLVKTSCMRGTLHLLAAADFPIYISALKTSRSRQMLAIMARYGVTQKESCKRRGNRSSLEIEPFESLSKTIRSKIEEEAARLADFFETSWEVKFSK